MKRDGVRVFIGSVTSRFLVVYLYVGLFGLVGVRKTAGRCTITFMGRNARVVSVTYDEGQG